MQCLSSIVTPKISVQKRNHISSSYNVIISNINSFLIELKNKIQVFQQNTRFGYFLLHFFQKRWNLSGLYICLEVYIMIGLVMVVWEGGNF